MQGSFATYLRCGRVVNSQIKKRSCRVCQWNNLKIGEYLEKLPAKRGCLVHFLGHLAVWWPGAQSAPDNINPLQGSVATYARRVGFLTYARSGGIMLTANFLRICRGIFQWNK